MAEKKLDLEALANAAAGASSNFGEGLQYFGAAKSYEANAGLYDLDAKMTLVDSHYAAKRMAEQGESFVGSQVAGYAKAGVLFEGSPMKVMLKTERNIRMDIMTTKYNAVRQANALGFQALKQRLAAGRARTRGVQAYGKGIMNMVGAYSLASS